MSSGAAVMTKAPVKGGAEGGHPAARFSGKMSGWLNRKFKKARGWFGSSPIWRKGFWIIDFERPSIEEYGDAGLEGFVATIDPRTVVRVKKVGSDKIDILVVNEVGEESIITLLVSDGSFLRDRWFSAFEQVCALDVSSKGHHSDRVSLKSRRFVKKLSIVTMGDGGIRTLAAITDGAVKSFAGFGRKSNLADEMRTVSEVSETGAMLSRRGSTSDTMFSQPNPAASSTDAPPSPNRPQSIQGRRHRTGSKGDQLDFTKDFMSKARNFAISINKDFQESVKKKGIYFPGAMQGERQKLRAAIIPVNAPEEKIENSRFKKTPEQNEMLLNVVTKEFSGFFGGTLLKEVDAQSIVDLMYTVVVLRESHVVLQGEATDKMYVIDSGTVGVYTHDFIDRPPELEIERVAGDSFGVLSLIYNQPAPFMIKTHTDCVLWALPSRKFHELTTNETKRRLARKVRLLNGIPLIADNIDLDAVTSLAESMEYREYSQGDVVLSIGDKLSNVWVVADGSACMLSDNQEGSHDVLLNKGDVFGEWALLGQDYISDVIIKAESSTLTMLCLNVTDVEELVGPLREFVLQRWFERQQSLAETKPGSHSTVGSRDGIASDDHKIIPTSSSPRPSIANAKLSTGGKLSIITGVGRKATGSRPGSFFEPVDTKASGAKRAVHFASVGSIEADPVLSDRSHLLGTKKTQVALRSNPSAHELLSLEEQERALAQVASELRKNEENSRKTKAATTIKLDDVVIESLDGGGIVDGEDEQESAENLDRPFIRTTPLRPDIGMESLTFVSLLGSGNFGKVHLVQNNTNPDELYALKVLTRHYIVLNGWEKMVENERDAMLELSTVVQSPFLLNLYNSFSDSKNVYLLLQLCEGGDLYNLMRATKSKRFDESSARFYISCVILGLEAMHSRDIVYRDLKPENLMIDKSGYIKIADFGLAKKTLRTFTVCGTPEYMAPEVILSHGHGLACDWWAAGIMLFEILYGFTPFTGGESFDVYERILGHKAFDDITFPVEDDFAFSDTAKDLICNLMHPKKAKRLGVKYPGLDAVKNHEFFSGLDWLTLEELQLSPPVVPTTSHIEKCLNDFKEGKPYDPKLWGAPDDHSGWTLSF